MSTEIASTEPRPAPDAAAPAACHAGQALTKIIATVGPASADPAILQQMIRAGVSVLRLNFSHGTDADHARAVRDIRREAARAGQPVAILGDLPGPKIRIGPVAAGGVEVPTGETVVIQREEIVADPSSCPVRFSSTYGGLIDDAQPGHRLLVDDGAVRMLIIDRDEESIRCLATQGGIITAGKGINMPDSRLSVSPITAADWRWVSWAIEHELDFLALSFVRHARDVKELIAGVRQRAEAAGRTDWSLPVVAKIERPEAVQDIEGIVQAADGVMIARGDLGVEMDLARVPIVQKRIGQIAQAHGKPCIVATQMLQSMIERSQPTRAEASDVANAIFELADAVMLSGETAIGRFPVLTVETMRRIAVHTEAHLAEQPPCSSAPQRLAEWRLRMAALAHGVWTVAQDYGARLVVVWSQSGGGARYLSQNNFQFPIVAVSSDDRALRQMQLLRGVVPVQMDVPANLAAFTDQADRLLLERGWAEAGDRCILVAGEPIGHRKVTNTLALHRIGDRASGYGGRAGEGTEARRHEGTKCGE